MHATYEQIDSDDTHTTYLVRSDALDGAKFVSIDHRTIDGESADAVVERLEAAVCRTVERARREPDLPELPETGEVDLDDVVE